MYSCQFVVTTLSLSPPPPPPLSPSLSSPPPSPSPQVFPVEEARVVQEFLSAVEGEVEEEITDEMSADQLLEKLERLEMLQQTQSSREGEVKAIDKSADSEEVKKALQKNPDISKERNNLLQGS